MARSFIGAQLKNIIVLLLFFATLTKNCSGIALKSKEQIIDSSTPSTEDYFESSTLDSVTSSSKSAPEFCQDVNSGCLTKECLRDASDLIYDISESMLYYQIQMSSVQHSDVALIQKWCRKILAAFGNGYKILNHVTTPR